MESDRRYYSRRAAQEKLAAARAVTANARNWHNRLAEDFMLKAERQIELTAAE
jgi:hypothetical protein